MASGTMASGTMAGQTAADTVTTGGATPGGTSPGGATLPGGNTAAGAGTQAATAAGGGGASSALGNGPVPSTSAPAMTSAQRTQDGLQYSGMGMMGVSVAAGAAGYWNNKRNGVDDATRASTAGRLSLAGEAAGGAGGVLGAALMLPGISSELKNGQGLQAGLSIAGSARGIVQGGALAYNVGRFAAGRTGGAFASDGLGRLAGSAAGQVVGGISRAATGAAAGRVAGEVAGRVAGMAATEAVAAAAGPVGWAIDAAVGVGFVFEAIAGAVKKAHQRKAMDNTVDPTLKQYGIPTPH